MKATPIPLLVGCLINPLANGCINRAPFERMLDKRSEYETEEDVAAESIKLASEGGLAAMDGAIPVRTPPKTANVWIYPHETPAKEYFWGGWITVVVEGDHWDLRRPADLAPEGAPIATQPKKKKK